ncbi:hypothetical protein F5Y16DRAFT_77331 [Xylariaceae sp. FL0255]|nr:hypothetical protein F5Y16DRAFT_77331 [Xylariaceae sp. FL0255]
MRFTVPLQALAVLYMAKATVQAPFDHSTAYPTRSLANITVIDTPIVREAQAYARAHSSDVVYDHIIRSWLFGVLILEHNATLKELVDPETHAVATLLHDLGWDQTPGSSVVSSDRRFEVDGAIAAREFLTTREPERWGERRSQLVWDSIALHTQESIWTYKEPVVMVTGAGIFNDFDNMYGDITQSEYDAVVKAIPRVDFIETVNQTFVWLCQSKPITTYDTFMQPWGDEFVQGYNATGYRVFDIITNDKDY